MFKNMDMKQEKKHFHNIDEVFDFIYSYKDIVEVSDNTHISIDLSNVPLKQYVIDIACVKKHPETLMEMFNPGDLNAE